MHFQRHRNSQGYEKKADAHSRLSHSWSALWRNHVLKINLTTERNGELSCVYDIFIKIKIISCTYLIILVFQSPIYADQYICDNASKSREERYPSMFLSLSIKDDRVPMVRILHNLRLGFLW